MAHGVLHEFCQSKESVEDFHKCFEFYCLANNIGDISHHATAKHAINIINDDFLYTQWLL